MKAVVIAATVLYCTDWQHIRVCSSPGHGYVSTEQRWQDWTIGSDSQGHRWFGQSDGRGGEVWTVEPSVGGNRQ